MKGFLATALALVPDFKAARLKAPIHLALSCDEEVGCVGVRPLVAYMKEHLPRPKAVIVGEPTSMKVVNAHKGAHTFSTEVLGHEAHSCNTHLGVNSILVAGELLTEVSRLAADMRDRGDPSGRFNPPYTTVHVGLIEGGTAKNIVPRRCAFRWETRLLPGSDPEEIPERFNRFARSLEPRMKTVAQDTGITTERTNAVPGLRPEDDSPAEHLAMHLAEANGSAAVSYCTEAGFFQEIGIPTIVCGPGSIDDAHKPDEYIALSEMEKCATFMRRLIRHCEG
jgi:acetylornithine deacetylase